MIGSIPVKIHNYPKEEADDEDASAGGDFGSSDSENSVSNIDEFCERPHTDQFRLCRSCFSKTVGI